MTGGYPGILEVGGRPSRLEVGMPGAEVTGGLLADGGRPNMLDMEKLETGGGPDGGLGELRAGDLDACLDLGAGDRDSADLIFSAPISGLRAEVEAGEVMGRVTSDRGSSFLYKWRSAELLGGDTRSLVCNGDSVEDRIGADRTRRWLEGGLEGEGVWRGGSMKAAGLEAVLSMSVSSLLQALASSSRGLREDTV